MENKVKKLDLAALLSTILWIGSIIFIVLMVVFNDQAKTDSTVKTIVDIIFAFAIVFLVAALVSTIVISIVGIRTKWDSQAIVKKSKLLFGLNFIPLLIGIPANIMLRTLIKHYIKGDKLVENEPTKIISEPKQESIITTTTTTTSTVLNKYPVNEPFFYNGKWMYFDGTSYFEANENNEWVPSTVIPN